MIYRRAKTLSIQRADGEPTGEASIPADKIRESFANSKPGVTANWLTSREREGMRISGDFRREGKAGKSLQIPVLAVGDARPVPVGLHWAQAERENEKDRAERCKYDGRTFHVHLVSAGDFVPISVPHVTTRDPAH